MASHLASIYGTEQDKVNCSFYYKIGACRHGDRCSRKHVHPSYSCTLMLNNVYRNPRHHEAECSITDSALQAQFDEFYDDMFCQLAQYGELLEMHVCDNVGDHLIGNVYARYKFEHEAQTAVNALNDRWYDGKPLFAQLSPVTDFHEACCRQNETQECNRGGFCNFMHLRYASAPLRRELAHQLAVELRMRNRRAKAAASPAKPRLGWKERLALEEQGAAHNDGQDADSGRDWRSQPRAAASPSPPTIPPPSSSSPLPQPKETTASRESSVDLYGPHHSPGT